MLKAYSFVVLLSINISFLVSYSFFNSYYSLHSRFSTQFSATGVVCSPSCSCSSWLSQLMAEGLFPAHARSRAKFVVVQFGRARANTDVTEAFP